MSVSAVIKVEYPPCFGSHEKFAAAAPDCIGCNSYESCEQRIDLDALLDDLPSEDDDAPRSTISSKTAIPNHSHGEKLNTSVPTVVSPLTLVSNSSALSSPASDPVESYTFPSAKQGNYSIVSDAKLVETLSELIARAFRGSAPLGYAAVRDEICGINLEMNARQRIAPRFRPMARLAQKPNPGAEADMARDRQVIDLHWRAFSTSKPQALIQNYEGIFHAPDFDLSLAERFAQEKWKLGAKVVHLHLTEDMQWEHAVLQTISIRDKWRTIQFGDVTNGTEVKQRGVPQVEAALRTTMANTPHLIRHIPGLLRVWTARRIVGDSPARIARLVALMTGEEPRDVRAIKKSVESLDKHLMRS